MDVTKVMSIYQSLYTASLSVCPVLAILLLGMWLKKKRVVGDEFVRGGNNIVFNIALPCLLFINVATNSLENNLNTLLVVYAAIATILSVLALVVLARFFVPKSQQGVFVQCSFRGNMAIIGLALAVSYLGEGIIPVVATYLAFITIMYNVLSIMVLTTFNRKMLVTITKNPLILGIVIGLVVSLLQISIPQAIVQPLNYLSQLTLPLALLCIGASLNWKNAKSNTRVTVIATLLKLIVIPGLVVTGGISLGLDQDALIVLFLMSGAPTAAAAFVMSKQLTSHGDLASEIITFSTLLSPLTITFGLVILA